VAATPLALLPAEETYDKGKYTMLDFLHQIVFEDHPIYNQLREYTIVITLIASLLLVVVMAMYKPKYRLDKAVFLRELALTLILLRFVKVIYFGNDIALWTPVLWGFLALSGILVLVELVREHFLILPKARTRDEISRKNKEIS
jgi:hypothetical protein